MSAEMKRKMLAQIASRRGIKTSTHTNAAPILLEQSVDAHSKDFPLSYAQERMWFLHQLDPAASAYNVCVIWHLKGFINAAALQFSAHKLCQRHHIFHVLYSINEHGHARQKLSEELPPEWSTADLSSHIDAEKKHRFEQLALKASTDAFDLSRCTTLRLQLVKLQQDHHALIMVGQHIVWDGPSFGIFAKELAEVYNQQVRGERDTRAPLPTQYQDFANWHRKYWNAPSEKREEQLAFWEKVLTPLPEALDFPADFERPVPLSESGSWYSDQLNEATTASLITLAERHQLTVFEVVIAAIAVLMTRLSHADEVTIGTVASHRMLPELNQLIGNFGNVIPLRIFVDNRQSFNHLLTHCAERCRSALANAEVPFEHLLEHLQIPRGADKNPLLDTMVTFLSQGMDAPTMDGLDVSWEKFFNGTSQTDLSFDALLKDGHLQLQATWRTSLYRPETIPAHVRRLKRILSDCLQFPDRPLAQLSLLLPEETPLLHQWGTRDPLPATANNLTDWFEDTVSRYPDRIALVNAPENSTADFKSYKPPTFDQLNSRANRLAHWLCSQHLGPENKVAIALPRTTDWYVAMLATLKCGAAFIPIDPDYPVDYIQRVLDLAKPELLFVDGSSSGIFDNLSRDIPLTILQEAEISAQEKGLISRNLQQKDRVAFLRSYHPICIVFTSGSSGQPKGVVVTHKAMVNLLASHRQDLYQEVLNNTEDRQFNVGHAWSLAFDAAWQPTLWLFEGHQIHLFSTEVMQDPIALAVEILKRRLDFIELTPGLLNEVLPWLKSGLTDDQGRFLPPHIPALLGFGGESVKPLLWKELTELPSTACFNLYGPTEATVDAMIAKAHAEDPANIGRPVAGAQALVLDHCLQMAAPGVAGELAIAGRGLARGYLKRGDLTASQFVANPHGKPGTRLYRTGDRVKWLANGMMQYLGRMDDQVKIRGFRVEPLDVEANIEKLIRLPCAVIAQTMETGTQLFCFVESHQLEQDSWRQVCRSNLPAHMQPQAFIPVKTLPRLPNGKINRQALQVPDELSKRKGREPTTPLQKRLCRLMSEVLGVETITIDDEFFDLGGDSISVVKLVSRARREEIVLSARQVFDHRTVSRLAELLETQTTSPRSSKMHDVGDRLCAPVTEMMNHYLCAETPLQRFAQITDVKLPSGIDLAALETILNAVIERHSILTCRLQKGDSDQYQLIPTELNSSIDILCVEPPEKDDLIEAQSLAKTLCQKLSPEQGSMLSAAWIKPNFEDKATSGGNLRLAIHHLAIDASSWHILVGDLAMAWQAWQNQCQITLPPIPTAWSTWARETQKINENALDRSFNHSVKGTLANITLCQYPIAEGLSRQTLQLQETIGVPMGTILPVLAGIALSKSDPCQKSTPVLITIEHHGRDAKANEQDLSRTIGWFAREIYRAIDGKFDDEVLPALIDELISAHNDIQGQIAQAGTDLNFQFEDQVRSINFNFLGEIHDGSNTADWHMTPRLDLIPHACSTHWPLLHDININAYILSAGQNRQLIFEAISPASQDSEEHLKILFSNLATLLEKITRFCEERFIRRVTPLQHQMLKHSGKPDKGSADPWTSQLEMWVESTEDSPLTADYLKHSADALIRKHPVLRSGFLAEYDLSYFLSPKNQNHVTADWQDADLSFLTVPEQSLKLTEIKQRWFNQPFDISKPNLLRFMAIRLQTHRWCLLINCHHLLLDGWSVPIIMKDWLLPAGKGVPKIETASHSGWIQYLTWLQNQPSKPIAAYWNNVLESLRSPTILAPKRTVPTPTLDLTGDISKQDIDALIHTLKKHNIMPAALYQWAWGATIRDISHQQDVVFGMFESGRSLLIPAIESAVGLVTQLVPIRLSPVSVAQENRVQLLRQVRTLQDAQLEWQSLPPVQWQNLDKVREFGDLSDSLLVIENGLAGDLDAEPKTPKILSKNWQDSIAQSVGLFVYPDQSDQYPFLRLCYDPGCFTRAQAEQYLIKFTEILSQVTAILTEPSNPHNLYPREPTKMTEEAFHEQQPVR